MYQFRLLIWFGGGATKLLLLLIVIRCTRIYITPFINQFVKLIMSMCVILVSEAFTVFLFVQFPISIMLRLYKFITFRNTRNVDGWLRIWWRRININIGIVILRQVVRHKLNVWTGGSLLPCILLGWTYIIYIPLRKLSFRIHCIYFKLHFVILR